MNINRKIKLARTMYHVRQSAVLKNSFGRQHCILLAPKQAKDTVSDSMPIQKIYLEKAYSTSIKTLASANV